MAHRDWTRARMLKLLRDLEKQYGFAGSSHLDALSRRLKLDLRKRIRNTFGTLREAKRRAGLKVWPLWSDERIYKALKTHARRGPIRYRQLKREDGALVAAIERRFGSIHPAMKRAGVEPAQPIHSAWKYPRERILSILSEAWKRRDIRVNPLRKRYPGIYKAAILECDSWQNALREAGVPSWAYATRMSAHRVALQSAKADRAGS